MKVSNINKNKIPKLIIVVPEVVLDDAKGILSRYLLPLNTIKSDIHIVGVPTPDKGKIKKDSFISEWGQIKEYAYTFGVKNIAVVLPEYMKFLTNSKKAFRHEIAQGTKEVIDGFNIFPLLNYMILAFSPAKKKPLARALNYIHDTVIGKLTGTEKDHTNLEKDLAYTQASSVKKVLNNLLNFKLLTCDIESTGLGFQIDKMLTISFSWDKHNAVCIGVHEQYSNKENSLEVQKALKEFFVKYYAQNGKIIGHNFLAFDLAYIVHEIMVGGGWSKPVYSYINEANIEDTLIMAYLVYNSTDRPPIGLKELAYPIMGNYDSNIDQRYLIKYPFKEVARYNNLDCIANWYIYDRLKEQVKEHKKLYDEYLQITKSVLKMKMNGFKVDLDKVTPAHTKLDTILKNTNDRFHEYKEVIETEKVLNKLESIKYNRTHVANKKPSDFDVKFLAGSTNHKTILFRDVLGMEPIKFSKKTKNPSYDKEVLKEYSRQAYNKNAKELADIVLEFSAARIVDSTFLKSFKKLALDIGGDTYLFTNFNMNGTLSSRMSSNNPNFSNMPSGSKYGKLIKTCFSPPKGFVMAGADFSSLNISGA